MFTNCEICGQRFYVKYSNFKRGWGKYCSKKCQFEGQKRGKWVNCSYCGKKIYRTPNDYRKSKSKKFYCSRSCHCAWENENNRSGINSPNWIAGHNTYRNILKRRNVEEKCVKCGNDDKRVLVVHHKDGNRKNNKYVNLVWLCRNCHAIAHSI